MRFMLALSPVAAQSAQVTISVTPNVTRILTVALATSVTYYDLGSVTSGSLIPGNTCYIVTNNGNVSESFVLQVSSESDPNPGPGITAPGFRTTDRLLQSDCSLILLFSSRRKSSMLFNPAAARRRSLPPRRVPTARGS